MEIGKGWNGQRAAWRGSLCRSDGRITVGVCAREKKARSKHMEAITSRLHSEKFEVVVFGDACILDDPVEKWPLCDCLIAFYSTGFPSAKAEAYVELRRPYALNNLEMQDVLHDRRRVYDLLKAQKVPHPDNVYASRDGYGGQAAGELVIVEADDYIQVNNEIIHKPFVEKPVDAENHNVYIYYPMSAGGGSKRLFRKIGDRSSEFYPHVNEIRRDGSFVYESFVETQGTDVKVYTVGPDYGHAEARKSPTLDGKVNRNAEGKEIRYPVILSTEEKEYARKITLAFKQCVCGFDILRVQGRSYVCDVNGWSFVKNSRKYVDDCAMLLREFIEAAVKPGRRTKVFSTEAPLIKYQAININHDQQSQQQAAGGPKGSIDKPPRINTNIQNGYGSGHRLAYLPHSPDSSVGSSSTPGSREVGPGIFAAVGSPASTPPRTPPGDGRSAKHQRKHPEELRAVIAITRHGDRTPKQKMKMKIDFPCFLAFYNKYSPGPRKEIKVKGKVHLKEFLGITVALIKTLRIASSNGPDTSVASSSNSTSTSTAEAVTEMTEVDAETYGKLHQIKHVLERWEISGINRKLQLKPRKWEKKCNVQPKPTPMPTVTSTATATVNGTGVVDEGGKQRPETVSPAAMEAFLSTGGGFGKTTVASRSAEGTGERAAQLLLILKWGGELTNLGQRQAIELGNSFRTIMYPDSGTGGLLRLHSTFRHDLKIKTSDEGRVMKTAAAFAKGFLELEGELTPILVSLVSKESSKNSSVMMLDPSGNKDIKNDMARSKEFLHRVMAQDASFTPDLIKSVVPTGQASVRRALRSVGNPVEKLGHLRQLVAVLVKQLSRRSAMFPLGATDRVSAADRELDRGIEADEFATSRVEIAEAREKRHLSDGVASADSPMSRAARDTRMPARGETPLLMLDRWRKLHDELYDGATGFDISKIPDVHDNVRYDGLHNAHLDLDGLPELYDLAKHLADSIVPQEYGVTKRGKLLIGSKMCSALLDKIKYDLLIARANNEVDMRYQLDLSHVEDLPINSLGRRVRTRLYFTSESHLHTLLNVLRFPIDGHEAVVTDEAKRMLSRTKELCYLTTFVLRLFEDTEKGLEDPARFRVEILFSPGVVKHPLLSGDHLHTAPLVPLHKNLTCKQVEDTLDAAIALTAREGVDAGDSEAEAILNKLEYVCRQQRKLKMQKEEQQRKEDEQRKREEQYRKEEKRRKDEQQKQQKQKQRDSDSAVSNLSAVGGGAATRQGRGSLPEQHQHQQQGRQEEGQRCGSSSNNGSGKDSVDARSRSNVVRGGGRDKREGILPGVIDRAWRRGRRERVEEPEEKVFGVAAGGKEDGVGRDLGACWYLRDPKGVVGGGTEREGDGGGRGLCQAVDGRREGGDSGDEGQDDGGNQEKGVNVDVDVDGDGHVCGDEGYLEEEAAATGEDVVGGGGVDDDIVVDDDDRESVVVVDDDDDDVDDCGSVDNESFESEGGGVGGGSGDDDDDDDDYGGSERGGMMACLAFDSLLSTRCESEVFGFAGSVVSTLDDSGSPRSDDDERGISVRPGGGWKRLAGSKLTLALVGILGAAAAAGGAALAARHRRA